MDGLTPLQRRFALEFIKDKNGTQAYIRAGGARKGASVEAYRILRIPKIREFIRRRIQEQEQELKTDSNRVLREWIRIAFFDSEVLDKLARDELKLEDLTADERAAIAEYTRTPGEFGTAIKVKAHPKKAALDALSKHFGLYKASDPDLEKIFKLAYSLEDSK